MIGVRDTRCEPDRSSDPNFVEANAKKYDRIVSASTRPVNDSAKVINDEMGDVGEYVTANDGEDQTPARAATSTNSASRNFKVSPRAMRQKCTQPVIPRATHTCTVPRPITMMRAISSKSDGTDANTVMTKNTASSMRLPK